MNSVASLQTAADRRWWRTSSVPDARSSPRQSRSHPSPRKSGAVQGPRGSLLLFVLLAFALAGAQPRPAGRESHIATGAGATHPPPHPP